MKSIVRQLSALIIFITLLHFLTGCEEKTKEADNLLPQENTTELVETKQDKPSKPLTPQNIPASSKPQVATEHEKKTKETENQPSQDILSKPSIPQSIPTPPESESTGEESVQQREPDLSTVYPLSGLQGERYKLSLNKDKVFLENSDKPFILIHLFNPDSNEAAAQAPYLSKLQKKFAEHLTIIAIPTKKTQDIQALRSWAQTYQTEYFISANQESNALAERLSEKLNITISPSLLLYHQGENYNCYEGITPIEMITHDILQAGKK